MVFFASYRPLLLSVLRIMSGLLLLQHGTTKFLGFPKSQMTGISPFTLPGIAGLMELIGGVLLVIGLSRGSRRFCSRACWRSPISTPMRRVVCIRC